MKTRYTVTMLRAGQPKPYADSEYEYLILCEEEKPEYPGVFRPWMRSGNIEDWAKSVVRALCQNFREEGDDDGRTGMEAAFYPTLKRLTVDAARGDISALIVERYND